MALTICPFNSTSAPARRVAQLTPAALADKSGFSLPTVRQSERGLGALSTFVALAAVLGCV